MRSISRDIRRIGLPVLLVLAGSLTGFASDAEPDGLQGPDSRRAEPLLALVPADAAAVLAVEDLRGRTSELIETPAAQGFRRLPAVQKWLASERIDHLRQAQQSIEDALGAKLTTLRDDLLGDAVVLALRIPPGGHPEDARGLLLAHVRDRGLLERLIRDVNRGQTRSGQLEHIAEKTHRETRYTTRGFRAETRRPGDTYVILDDNTFAWSNSEELIRGVIDHHKTELRSILDTPRFQKVRRKLGGTSLVSLYLDPRILGSQQASKPRGWGGELLAALRVNYFEALEYIGIGLDWRDGIVIQTEEVLRPDRLDSRLRRWSQGAVPTSLAGRRVPDAALALVALNVDFPAAFDLLKDFTSETQQPRLENLETILNGILLGHDLRTDILPQLGPKVLFSLEPSFTNGKISGPLARVLSISLNPKSGDHARLDEAIVNALRTYLAAYALDSQHARGQLRLERREVEDRSVYALRPRTPLAFAIDGGQLLLANNAEALAHVLTNHPAGVGGSGGGVLDRLRKLPIDLSGSFAWLDVAGLQHYVEIHRKNLVVRLAAQQKRPEAEVRQDLVQAVALMALFQDAYFTSSLSPDASSMHRTFGLLARDPAPAH